MSDIVSKSRNRFGLPDNNDKCHFFVSYKCTFNSSLCKDSEVHFCSLSKSVTYVKIVATFILIKFFFIFFISMVSHSSIHLNHDKQLNPHI